MVVAGLQPGCPPAPGSPSRRPSQYRPAPTRLRPRSPVPDPRRRQPGRVYGRRQRPSNGATAGRWRCRHWRRHSRGAGGLGLVAALALGLGFGSFPLADSLLTTTGTARPERGDKHPGVGELEHPPDPQHRADLVEHLAGSLLGHVRPRRSRRTAPPTPDAAQQDPALQFRRCPVDQTLRPGTLELPVHLLRRRQGIADSSGATADVASNNSSSPWEGTLEKSSAWR